MLLCESPIDAATLYFAAAPEAQVLLTNRLRHIVGTVAHVEPAVVEDVVPHEARVV